MSRKRQLLKRASASSVGRLALLVSLAALWQVAGVAASSAATPGASPGATPGTPHVYGCVPGDYAQTEGYNMSFIQGSPDYTFSQYNFDPTWQEIGNLTIHSSQSYSTAWGGQVGANGSIDLIIGSIGGSADVTLVKTSDKSTGWSFSSGPLDTPPHYWAHFQAGSWSEHAYGANYYLNSSCQSIYQSSWNVNVPKENDLGINTWYNTTD